MTEESEIQIVELTELEAPLRHKLSESFTEWQGLVAEALKKAEEEAAAAVAAAAAAAAATPEEGEKKPEDGEEKPAEDPPADAAPAE